MGVNSVEKYRRALIGVETPSGRAYTLDIVPLKGGKTQTIWYSVWGERIGQNGLGKAIGKNNLTEAIFNGKPPVRNRFFSPAILYKWIYGTYDHVTKVETRAEQDLPWAVDYRTDYYAYFRDRNGKAFSAWASADSALALMLASALVIRPFAEGLGIKDAMEEADRLLVDSFFEYEFSELGFGENERRAATHGAAVLIASSAFYRKGEEAIDLFAPITSDSGIQDLTQCNEYQGEIWYNKEQMQRVILLSALSFALTPKAKDFDPDGYIRTLFEKEAASGYKLRELLRKNDEPEEDDEEKED